MASSKLSLKFRIFKGSELVGFRELNQAVIKIGKVSTAHLCVEDESVSRMHAIIEVADTVAHIIDLGSTRGTFINGKRINKARLSDGDEIQVGDVRIELALGDASAPVVEAPKAAAVPPALPKTVTMPKPTTPMPQPLQVAPLAPAAFAAAIADDETGVRAIEVATMLGDSVVDVKHCMDPRGGKVTPMTWGFLAGGLACLLASATAFYVSVDTAAKNKASLAYHTHVLKKPAFSHRPEQIGAGVDWVAFGGLALGLLGMTAGLARARGEKKSPYYRIGTAPGVQQPVENAPAADFPMVAPAGDEFVFNYGAGMEGEMIVDGKSTPLTDLVNAGLARPSTTIASAIEVPLTAKMKIRARSGQTTFLVSSVNKPKKHAAPLFTVNRRIAGYVAGSLAVHIGIIAFLQTIPEDGAGVNVDFGNQEHVAMTTSGTQTDDVPPELEKDKDNGASGKDSAGGRMALDEGAAGKPDAPNKEGHMRVKDNGQPPALTKEQAIQEAANAGFMGSYQMIQGGIAALNGEAKISSGFDDSNVYGPLFGAEGEGQGNWGMGVHGWGPGGGCLGGDCGLVGTGRYGTIFNGDKAGDGWNPGKGNGKWFKHTASVPPVNIPMPSAVTDGLDKSIIKRYVKRSLAKISYCYESELIAHPTLEGVVTVQFLISAKGTVTKSVGAGVSDDVASCVAGVIAKIEFPAPSNGGTVQVNYPFTLRATH